MGRHTMDNQQNRTLSSNIGEQGRESSLDTKSQSAAETRHLGFRTNSEEARLLRLAGTLLARSDALENSIAAIEAASQACKCAQIVSDSIVDLLEKAKLLLYKMRDIPDPKGRVLLASSFNEFLAQIDLLVVDGHYDGRNLARNENIFISTSGAGDQGLSIPGIDMSSGGLDLKPLPGETISNGDIVDRLTKTESAAGILVAHSFTYDAIAFLLQSRMKFARGMIDVLEEGNDQINESRAGHAAVSHVLSEIYGAISTENGAETNATPSRPARDLSSSPHYSKSVVRPPL